MKVGGSTTLVAPSVGLASDRPGEVLLWLATLLTLVPQLVRASTNMTIFPGWDLDPTIYAVANNAVTPMGSMLIDGLTVFGAGLLLIWSARRGIGFHRPLVLLTLIGAAAVVLHGWVVGPNHGSLGDQRIGASWLSAMFGGLGLWHAAQDLRVRRLFAGTLLGFMALLSLHGVVQVYYIHAQTVADFEANPNKVYVSHGWLPDSSMAKAFARRLKQSEASGWFGLANVYATFAAAGVAAGVGLLGHQLFSRASVDEKGDARPRSVVAVMLLVFFTLASAIALFLAHAKGGFAAVAGALVAIPVLILLARGAASHPGRARAMACVLGLSAIVAPLVLIFIRGRLGEHFAGDEHSLLFRSFYARAAGPIFLEHPILGVGPDGFQRAFTMAKPPLCPEEVSSPHCIVWDWLADLGILGLAWICILARWAMQATANAVGPCTSTPRPLASSTFASSTFAIRVSREDLRLLFFLPAAATVFAAFVETPYIPPEGVLIRIVGLGLWCGASWAIASSICDARGVRIALAAAAMALIAHAQIDVTASFVASAPLWAMLIATMAAPAGSFPDQSKLGGAPRRASIASGIPVIGPPLVLAVLLLATTFTGVREWERHLTVSAETLRPIAEVSDRLASLGLPRSAGQAPTDSIDKIVRDLAEAVGHPVQPTKASIESARIELVRRLFPGAAAELESACSIYPDDRRPLREASRLQLQLAEIAHAEGKPDLARDELGRAVRMLRLPAPPSTANPGKTTVADPSSSEWHWLAVILERGADMLGEPESRLRAIEARVNVAKLDPYNLDNALRVFRDYRKLNDDSSARIWAAKALELHEYTRLDRETRGLSPADLAEVQEAAGKP